MGPPLRLANAANGKNYIETVWGLGYVLHDPVEIEDKNPGVNRGARFWAPLLEDLIAENVVLPGSPAGSNGPTSFGSGYACAITLRTDVACHCLPRGALIPRAFRTSAICRSDVAPVH
jgi:hypothetical protein